MRLFWLIFLFPVLAFSAQPPIVRNFSTTNTDFKIIGTNGINISSNPTTGTYLIDGRNLTNGLSGTNGLTTTNLFSRIYGTNGIGVSSNTANGTWLIDGASLSNSIAGQLTNNWGFNTNQFARTGTGGTNVNIKNGVMLTNPVTFWSGSGDTLSVSNDGAGGFKAISSDNGNFFELTGAGEIVLSNQPGPAILHVNVAKRVQTISNGTGAMTNDGAGLFGWFPGYITAASLDGYGFNFGATNIGSMLGRGSNFVFITESNLTQFATNYPAAGGTNVVKVNTAQPITTTSQPTFAGLRNTGTTTNTGAINNGGITTNFPGSTTTIPFYTALAGGHNTDAMAILQGPAKVGGFDSNGVAFMIISNAATVYPAAYRIFTQTADNTVTNITTSETSWFGTGVGSRTLPANFWQVGRSVRIEFKGHNRTGAAPNNNSLRIKYGSTQVATNYSVFTWVANLADEYLEGDILITCRTNSATVGYLEVAGRVCNPSAAGGAIYSCKGFKSSLAYFDTTASGLLDLVSTNGASTTSFTTRECIYTVIP